MKKVIFRPTSKETELLVPPPKSAKEYIPDWFKNIPQFKNNKFEVDDLGNSSATMKMCMPFLDTFLTGYIQETWVDIFVEIKDGNFRYTTPSTPSIMEHRSEDSQYYPKLKGYCPQEFTWKQPWIPELPDGWSMLYIHPLNRLDLPFLNLTAIIDNDKYVMEKTTNHPFFIQENFQGVIPKGTPYMQMIPIKRDSWKMITEPYSENLSTMVEKVRQYFVGGYKKLYWQKKDYR